MFAYKTISHPSEGYFTEQRSKFLSFAFPVETAEEALLHVNALRKKYYDARHVCWAYKLLSGETRVNDDGEPSSTAGKPILGVIYSNGLSNILIAVVRYFGGIKLGTGGLIVAYRAAAQDATANAIIVEKTEEEEITITFDYPLMDKVMRIVKEENLRMISQQTEMVCKMTLVVARGEVDRLKQRLAMVTNAVEREKSSSHQITELSFNNRADTKPEAALAAIPCVPA